VNIFRTERRHSGLFGRRGASALAGIHRAPLLRAPRARGRSAAHSRRILDFAMRQPASDRASPARRGEAGTRFPAELARTELAAGARDGPAGSSPSGFFRCPRRRTASSDSRRRPRAAGPRAARRSRLTRRSSARGGSARKRSRACAAQVDRLARGPRSSGGFAEWSSRAHSGAEWQSGLSKSAAARVRASPGRSRSARRPERPAAVPPAV
jgi:hypothetical protein